MRVTEVSVVRTGGEIGLVGFARLNIENCLCLADLAIYRKPGGDIRLRYPEKTLKNGKVVDIYYPFTKDMDVEIKRAVEDEFLKVEKMKLEKSYDCITAG